MQQKKIILKLLQPGNNKSRIYASWTALCIGMLLLFAALQAWVDFRTVLRGKSQQDMMAHYLIIGKEIGKEQASELNLFTAKEIDELRQVPGVDQVGSVQANRFPVDAQIGGNLGFSTALFLEAIDDKYLDQLPDDWQWEPGNPTVPIILSNDFLNLYNYGFALSQGLPQLSTRSIRALPFQISIAGGQEVFRARITGFTDRISSILVPQHFMEEMNRQYGQAGTQQPSRLMLQVKDPADKELISFLQGSHYTTNTEQLRWNRVSTVAQAIVSAVGFVALIVVGMSVLAFILFVEVSIRRAAVNIRLMLQIGYRPLVLKRMLLGYFMPWLVSAILIAALVAFLLHVLLATQLNNSGLTLSWLAAWPIGIVLLIMIALLGLLLNRSIGRMLASL